MLPDAMLATSSTLEDAGFFITDDGWVLEQKLDGHRIRWDLTNGKFLTRAGTEYTKPIPQALRDMPKLENGWMLDGELVDGKFYAFDILQDGGNAHLMSLSERRALMAALVDSLVGILLVMRVEDPPLGVVRQATTTEEKHQLVEDVIRNGSEGVVAKRKSSVYTAGRGVNWLKIKITVTADVVVMAVRDDGKDSAKLGIQRNGALKEIGRCSLIGKPPVKVGDVVEVKYLYMTPDERLYQPTLMRVRFDKTPDECDGSDFRFVNKSVL